VLQVLGVSVKMRMIIILRFLVCVWSRYLYSWHPFPALPLICRLKYSTVLTVCVCVTFVLHPYYKCVTGFGSLCHRLVVTCNTFGFAFYCICVTFVLQMCYRFWLFVCVSLSLSFLSISSFYSLPLFSFSFHFSPHRYYGTFHQYCFIIILS
jgi:prepilin signal peptidase PulO-like enzyme (type II secretory pathway)